MQGFEFSFNVLNFCGQYIVLADFNYLHPNLLIGALFNFVMINCCFGFFLVDNFFVDRPSDSVDKRFISSAGLSDDWGWQMTLALCCQITEDTAVR